MPREHTGPLPAQSAGQRYSAHEAHVLASHSYPNGPSGFCSAHNPMGPHFVDCTVCFPDLNGLISEQGRLKQLAWARLRELGEPIPGLNGDDPS